MDRTRSLQLPWIDWSFYLKCVLRIAERCIHRGRISGHPNLCSSQEPAWEPSSLPQSIHCHQQLWFWDAFDCSLYMTKLLFIKVENCLIVREIFNLERNSANCLPYISVQNIKVMIMGGVFRKLFWTTSAFFGLRQKSRFQIGHTNQHLHDQTISEPRPKKAKDVKSERNIHVLSENTLSIPSWFELLEIHRVHKSGKIIVTIVIPLIHAGKNHYSNPTNTWINGNCISHNLLRSLLMGLSKLAEYALPVYIMIFKRHKKL